MSKREFYLTAEEVQQFRRAEQQTRAAHELRRLQGVRMYGTGESLTKIKEVVNAAERTIRKWVQRYSQKGVPHTLIDCRLRPASSTFEYYNRGDNRCSTAIVSLLSRCLGG